FVEASTDNLETGVSDEEFERQGGGPQAPDESFTTLEASLRARRLAREERQREVVNALFEPIKLPDPGATSSGRASIPACDLSTRMPARWDVLRSRPSRSRTA